MLPEFDEIISNCSFDFDELEKLRKKYINKSKTDLKIGLITDFILSALGVLLFMKSIEFWGIILIIFGQILFIRLWSIFNKRSSKILKKKIFSVLMKLIGGEFKYFIDYSKLFILNELGFDNRSFFACTDFFGGKVADKEFWIGDIIIKIPRDTNYEIIFNGVFAVVEFEMNFPNIQILPKNDSDAFSFNSRKMQEIFFLEDINFTDNYSVITDNQEIARLILTSELRDYLKTINRKHNIYILFFKNKMIFADNTKINMFELDFRKPISIKTMKNFYKNFAKYYNILQNIVTLVEVIDNYQWSMANE